MPIKKRKKKSKIYFGKETQDAVILYNSMDAETQWKERDKLFREKIYYPFSKLSENIIHTFKFYHFDYDSKQVQNEVVSFLTMNMHKYQPDKGRAFSYFSIIAKNYLILNNNNNYKKTKLHKPIDKTEVDDNYLSHFDRKEFNDDVKIFLDSFIEYFDLNIARIFKRKKDIIVADSIIELIRKRENIENFNKKALYILIREMTGSNTQHITRILNIVKSHYKTLYKEFVTSGTLELSNTGSLFNR